MKIQKIRKIITLILTILIVSNAMSYESHANSDINMNIEKNMNLEETSNDLEEQDEEREIIDAKESIIQENSETIDESDYELQEVEEKEEVKEVEISPQEDVELIEDSEDDEIHIDYETIESEEEENTENQKKNNVKLDTEKKNHIQFRSVSPESNSNGNIQAPPNKSIINVIHPQSSFPVNYTWSKTERWDGSGAKGNINTNTSGEAWWLVDNNGNHFFCIEPGVFAKDGGEYTNVGRYVGYKAEDIKLAIRYANNVNLSSLEPMENQLKISPVMLNLTIWKLLGRANVTNWAASNIDKIIKAINDFKSGAYPYPEHFNGEVELFRYSAGSEHQQIISYNYTKESNYNLSLKKVSANKSMTDLAVLGYSVENAEYGIYSSASDAREKKNMIGKLVTKSDGISNIINLKSDTYFIKELKAPKGFYLDEKIHQVNLTKDIELKLEDKPKFDPLRIMLEKKNEKSKPLSGAIFEVKYYDGQIKDISKSKAIRTWKFKTDINGRFSFSNEDKVDGDDLFTINGIPIGLIGTYTFQEISAPESYVLDNTLYYAYVKDNENVEQVNGTGTIYNAPVVANKKIEGKIKVIKTDSSENKLPIEGVEFEILEIPERNLVEKITTDEKGIALSKKLLYGDYIIREVSAPKEYYLNSNEYPVAIKNDGKVEELNIQNDLILVKLKIQKVDHDTKEALQGVEFEIINSETDEKVIFTYLDDEEKVQQQGKLVTDNNGEAFTKGYLPYGKYKLVETKPKAGYIKGHDREFVIDRNTEIINIELLGKTKIENISNLPTRVIIRKVDVNNEMLEGAKLKIEKVNEDGTEELIVFTSTNEEFSIKNLEVGQKYRLVELEAPEGYLLSEPIEFTIRDTPDNQIITIVNEYIPEIKTTALFEDGTKTNMADKNMKVIDIVKYEKLIKGIEYELTGILMDKSTNKPLLINGQSQISIVKFTPEKSSGIIEIEFNFDATNLGSKEIVVFENLYKDKKLVATHSDINDSNQTVKIFTPPQIPKAPPTSKTPPIPKIQKPKSRPKNPQTGDEGILLQLGILAITAIVLNYIRSRKYKSDN